MHAAPHDHFHAGADAALDLAVVDGAGAASVAAASAGGARRRLPRRRRLLERDRVFDGALVEGLLLVFELQQLERQQPCAFAGFAAALHQDVERGAELLRSFAASAHSAACALRPAHRPAAARRRRRTRPPRQIEPRVHAMLGHRAPQRLDLRRRGGGQLAGQHRVAAAVAFGLAAGAGVLALSSQPGGERSNCTTYLQRELVERGAVVRPLHADRTARATRAASSAPRRRSARPVRAGRAPAAPGRPRTAARRSRAPRTSPGLVCATSIDVRTGDHSMRLAPVTEISPAGSARGRSAAPRRPCACTATSRAETGARGAAPLAAAAAFGFGGVGFLGRRFVEKGPSNRQRYAVGMEPCDYVPKRGPYKATTATPNATAGRAPAVDAWLPPASGRAEALGQPRFCAAKSQFSSLSITASTYAARLFWWSR